jgi:ATP-dependent exoDNAse (exonuclease V) beta subunit
MGRKADWPDPKRHTAAREALAALAERLADWPERFALARRLPTSADGALIQASGALSRVVEDAVGRLRAASDAAAVIGFTDLQLRAVDVVRRFSEVRSGLVARHRWLMVDEFQDTDALQWEMLELLARPDGRPSDRLFAVGDAKQAIYGFRGGDVTVFRRAAASMAERGRTARMAENFRTRPELITWMNQLFAGVHGEGGAPWEAPFEPLTPGRDATGGDAEVLLDVPGDDPPGVWQSRAAARWISRALAQDPELAALPSPPVAVLLRSRTRLPEWTSELRKIGIPFTVGAGVGFWERQEVVDLVTALEALATESPRAWAAVLRSPLVALADRHLAAWAGVGLASPPPEGSDPELARAWQTCEELRALRADLPPSGILADLVGRMLPTLVWSDAGGTAEANARRLVSVARGIESRPADPPAPESAGPPGLIEVAAALCWLRDHAPREAEATVRPGAARVVLLTAHAAKGLEFPIVVVPHLEERSPPIRDPLVVARLHGSPVPPDGSVEWHFACRVEDPDAAVQTAVRPGLLQALIDAREEEEDAELRRLLYVACTRARDRLLLIAERPPENAAEPRRKTWRDAVLANLPAGTCIRTRDEVMAWPEIGAGAPRSAVAPEPGRAVPRRQRVVLTASALDEFRVCPGRWYRRSQLGSPEHRSPVRDQALRLAGVRGAVLHGLLEDGEADPDRAAARFRARARADGCDESAIEAALPSLLAQLASTRASPALGAVFDAPGATELGFRVVHGDCELVGQIDRLYRDERGEWVVLDWKSEAIRGSLPLDAERHRTQLLAYAWAASRVLGEPVRRSEVWFTAAGTRAALGPWTAADFTSIEALIDEVGEVARLSPREVDALATSIADPSPCARCGWLGTSCPGRGPSPLARSASAAIGGRGMMR